VIESSGASECLNDALQQNLRFSLPKVLTALKSVCIISFLCCTTQRETKHEVVESKRKFADLLVKLVGFSGSMKAEISKRSLTI
jgi:hypothetical protein